MRIYLPRRGTPDRISAKWTNFMPPTAAAAQQYYIDALMSQDRSIRDTVAVHLQTGKASALLVNKRMPLRTLRGKGSTSRNVNSIGGGRRKFTRTFQPVSA